MSGTDPELVRALLLLFLGALPAALVAIAESLGVRVRFGVRRREPFPLAELDEDLEAWRFDR